MEGIRVLDLSDSVAGGYASRMLAGAGASVVLGEAPGGSRLRLAPPHIDVGGVLRSAAWEYFTTFKEIVEVAPKDRVALAGEFDAVILGSDSPGPETAELAAALRHQHPHLAVAAVTPYGLTGPRAGWRGGPLEHWALGGQMALNGEPDREPIPGGGSWASCVVGANAAVALQAGLLRTPRERGALIDVSAQAALASAHQWSLTMYTHTGTVKQRAGNRHGEMHHPLNLYECSDGWVCIAAASLNQWEGLCIAMDQVELLAQDELASAAVRYDRAEELDALITEWTVTRTTAEVIAACQENFCPAGIVGELADTLRHEQLEHRDYWHSLPDLGSAAKVPGVPYRTERLSVGGAALVDEVATRRSEITGGGGFAPLAGVRVVELTISWAGPLAGRLLADLGADVVKVEHPTSRGVAVLPPDPDAEPDPWQWGELPPTSVRNGIYPNAEPGDEWWNRMSMWNKMNRSKRSLCLDVKGDGGREAFERLIATADIVLNNYSPRGVRSLGIHHDDLRRIKPDLVTVSMSGFGSTGPGAEAVSWGPILDAASGLASTTGYPDSGPYKQGIAFPDPVGGLHGASAALAAWEEHLRTGDAVHVDLSQLETLLCVAGDQVLETALTGRSPQRRGARSSVYAPAGAYRCRGADRWLALTAYDEVDWTRLAGLIPALDRVEWAEVGQRHLDHDEIDRLIGAWTAALDPHDAVAELQRAGVAAAVVATNQDLVEDVQLESRGFMVTVDQHACGPWPYPGSHFLVDGAGLPVQPVSPLGGDNDDVLRELGYSADAIEAMAAAGTIASAPPW